MAIAALSTAGFSQYVSASSDVSASQQAWQSLQQSLAAGNLSSAQTAFNTYSQLNQNLLDTASTGSSTSSSSNSQLSTDMQALGGALSAGDLSTAQSAFATVQNDLKSAPPEAVTNAEAAVSQTVEWMDDLLSLSDASNTSTTPEDPTTAILDSAYGYNSGTSSTDPTTSILNSAYGADDNMQSSSASSTNSAASTPDTGATAATSDDSTATSTPASSGNTGSSASVNVYA